MAADVADAKPVGLVGQAEAGISSLNPPIGSVPSITEQSPLPVTPEVASHVVPSCHLRRHGSHGRLHNRPHLACNLQCRRTLQSILTDICN